MVRIDEQGSGQEQEAGLEQRVDRDVLSRRESTLVESRLGGNYRGNGLPLALYFLVVTWDNTFDTKKYNTKVEAEGITKITDFCRFTSEKERSDAFIDEYLKPYLVIYDAALAIISILSKGGREYIPKTKINLPIPHIESIATTLSGIVNSSDELEHSNEFWEYVGRKINKDMYFRKTLERFYELTPSS